MSYTFQGRSDATHYEKRAYAPNPSYDLEKVKKNITDVHPHALSFGDAHNCVAVRSLVVPNTDSTEEVTTKVQLAMIKESKALKTESDFLKVKLSQRSMESLCITIMACRK